MNTRAALFACLFAAALGPSAQANDDVPPHWIARIGVHPVDPKPNNHDEFYVDNASGLSFGATYLLTKHWAIELFSAFPAGNDVHDSADTRVARFTMIPSSATLQYHITDASGVFRAYAGAGVSYAHLGGESTKASLAGQTLELDDSTGLSAVFGLDMYLGSRWFVNVDARWMDIDSSMEIDGQPRGALELDPYIFGLSLGRRLR